MISVIVPIYGVEAYIKQCVDSIIAQKYKDLEIILVDDGSKDNCPAICDEYAKIDDRIKVVHKQNGGLVSARQAGLKVATGEYIGFVDGDDWIADDMYQTMADVIEKYSPDVIASEFISEYETKSVVSDQLFEEGFYDKSRLESEIYPKMLFKGTFYQFGIFPNCWTKLFKREILEKNLPKVDTRIKMGEDAAFTYACLLDANSFYGIKKGMYHYRILASSMSRGYDAGLESIIFLPYNRLVDVNNSSTFDMSDQLSYYMIYLANFLIRNEAKSKTKDKNFVKRILNNEQLKKSADLVDENKLPGHTKVIVKAIRKNSSLGLGLYIWLLKKYLK